MRILGDISVHNCCIYGLHWSRNYLFSTAIRLYSAFLFISNLRTHLQWRAWPWPPRCVKPWAAACTKRWRPSRCATTWRPCTSPTGWRTRLKPRDTTRTRAGCTRPPVLMRSVSVWVYKNVNMTLLATENKQNPTNKPQTKHTQTSQTKKHNQNKQTRSTQKKPTMIFGENTSSQWRR